MNLARNDRLADYPESQRYLQVLSGDNVNAARASEVVNKTRDLVGRTLKRRKQ